MKVLKYYTQKKVKEEGRRAAVLKYSDKLSLTYTCRGGRFLIGIDRVFQTD